jgi:enoyl-CoA hydratase/carnithine racemase
MTDAPFVLRDQSGGVVRLTLNRGERYNPLSAGMIAALQGELDALMHDSSARVVVLAAAGKGFCAGHDLKELRANPGRQIFEDCSRMMLALTRLPQPVIARVHGIATAAGCQLVSMCDLAVAAEEAKFALPGVNVGIFCSTPAVGVGRNVPKKRAMEMLLTGDWIDARTALDWALVNRVVPAGQLDAEIEKLCASIASKSAAVVALGKRAFYQQIEKGLEGAYADMNETMACNMGYEDAGEGIGAFIEKRPPSWRDK